MEGTTGEASPPFFFFFIGHAHTSRRFRFVITTGLFLIFRRHENDTIVLFLFSLSRLHRPTTRTEFLSPLIRPRSPGETLAQRLDTIHRLRDEEKTKSSRIIFRSRFFFCRPTIVATTRSRNNKRFCYFPNTPFCIFYNIRFACLSESVKNARRL